MTAPSLHRPASDPEADYRPPALEPLVLALPRALAGGKVAFIHARRDVRQSIRRGKLPFFNYLIGLLRGRGYGVTLISYYRPPYPRWIGGRSLHIYRGPGRPRRGPGVLHVAKGYLNGYWYVDPMGQRAWSSIGGRAFDPDAIEPERANALFRTLRRGNVRKGHSARGQVPRGTVLPEGAISVFLQGVDGEAVAPVCSEADMLRAIVAARRDRPVLIKEHPLGTPRPVARAMAEVAGRDVRIVNANVHDILEASDVVATMSSGVGFEALLHRKPVLVFSTVDYHHGVTTLGDLADLPGVMATLPGTRRNDPKYVCWFTEGQLFHLNQPDLADRLGAVIDAAGRQDTAPE